MFSRQIQQANDSALNERPKLFFVFFNPIKLFNVSDGPQMKLIFLATLFYLAAATSPAASSSLSAPKEASPRNHGAQPRAVDQRRQGEKRIQKRASIATDALETSSGKLAAATTNLSHLSSEALLDDGRPEVGEPHGSQAAAALEWGRRWAEVADNEQPSGHNNISTQHMANRLGAQKLRIIRLLAPEATQNGTQNVTIDCMFNFDRKLDQRLTIKWFFNDELEPIYQWIPELDKRVYSDKYEHFLDKSYEVSEDVDFMLQAYKRLLANGSGEASSQIMPNLSGLNEPNADELATQSGGQDNNDNLDNTELASASSGEQRLRLEASRKSLANRLQRLAKLGGQHSRQLLESLRSALLMDQLDYSRFRALRLVRPTSELSGRFTCSVSSLDGDDLSSTRLLVYEPAKNFSFQVSRHSPGQYNLSCQAGPLFPRPSLALFRYRAGPLEPGEQALRQNAPNRPKLAATRLRQELLLGTQTQLTVRARRQDQFGPEVDSEAALVMPMGNQISAGEPGLIVGSGQIPATTEPSQFEIAAWALVDEASLSGNVITQFECLLSIEGTGYNQRQSLGLQKGWHVNSAALSSRSTLLGLFSALASLLCLMLALVSAMLIFRLLKRHAKSRRIHQEKSQIESVVAGGATSTLRQNGLERTLADRAKAAESPDSLDLKEPQAEAVAPHPYGANNVSSNGIAHLANTAAIAGQPRINQATDDGVYRIPETSSFGTRFIIGPMATSRQLQHQQQYFQGSHALPISTIQHNASLNGQQPTTRAINSNFVASPIDNNTKPLYC